MEREEGKLREGGVVIMYPVVIINALHTYRIEIVCNKLPISIIIRAFV